MQKRIISLLLCIFILCSLCIPSMADNETANIALNKPAFAINSQDGTEPSMAVDGDIQTSWISGSGNGFARQFILDLGSAYAIEGIELVPAETDSSDNITVYGAQTNIYADKSKIAEVVTLGDDGSVTVDDTATAYRYLVFERAFEETENPFGFAEIKVYTTDETVAETQSVSLATTPGKEVLSSNTSNKIGTAPANAGNLLDGDKSTYVGATAAAVDPVRIMVNLGKATKLSHVAFQCAGLTRADYYKDFWIVATDSYTDAKKNFNKNDYDILASIDGTALDSKNDSGLIVFDVSDEFKDNLYSWVGIIKPCATEGQTITRLAINTLQAYAPVIAGDGGDDGEGDGSEGDGEGSGEQGDISDSKLDLTLVSDIAAYKPAFALASADGTDPRMAVDGDTETFWTAKNVADNSEQLVVDLGGEFTVKGIGILPGFSGSADNITVYGASDKLYKDKTELLAIDSVDGEEMYIEKAKDKTSRYIIFERPTTAADTPFALSEIAIYVPNDELEGSVSAGPVSLLTLGKTTYMSNLADSYHNASKYDESKTKGFNDDDPTTSSGDATSEKSPMRIIIDMGIPMKLTHVAVQIKSSSVDYGSAFKIVATDSYSSAKDNYNISHYDVIATVDTLKRDSKHDSGLVVIEVPDEYKDNEYQFVGIIKEHATTVTGAANNFNRLSINTMQAYAKSSDVSDYISDSGSDYVLSDISSAVSDSKLTIKASLLNGENADKLVSVFMRNTDSGEEVIFAESTIAHAGAYNNLTIDASVTDGTEGTWEAALIKGRTIIKYYENLRKQTERVAYSGAVGGDVRYNQIGSSITAAVEADCSVMAMIILNPGANPESFGADDIFAYSLAKSPKESSKVWTHTFDYTMPSDAPEGEYGVVFVTDNSMSVLAKTDYVFNKTDASDITDAFDDVTENSFAELVEANKGFFGTIADELLASDTMGQSFMLAKDGFEKGIFDKTLTNWSDVNTITAAAKAALVIDGAFMENDIDISPYIGSMPDVFTDSYDADEFAGILASVQKTAPRTAAEAATALGRASALCLVANGSVEDIQYALTNYSEKLGISKSTLNTKYSMLDIAGKLSNDIEVVKSSYADGMDSEVSVALTQLKSEDTIDSEEKGHSQGGKKGISIGTGSSVAPLPPITDSVIQPELVSGFWDIVDYDWAKDAIATLSQRGIISGKGSGVFDPAGELTREETVKLLILAMNLTTDGLGENNYSDCSVGQWYYPFVTAAKVNELVYGISKQEFGLGLNVTRQDLAVMLYRALNKKGIEYEGEAVAFTDSFAVSEYAKEAVNTLAGLGIVTGYTDGSFGPGDSATRAEAAVIFHRFLNIVESYK